MRSELQQVLKSDGQTVLTANVVHVESCAITHNGTGVLVSETTGTGTASISRCLIAANISFGNNGLHGNSSDGSFTTTVAQQ